MSHSFPVENAPSYYLSLRPETALASDAPAAVSTQIPFYALAVAVDIKLGIMRLNPCL